MNPIDDQRSREPQPDIVPWRAREAIALFVVSFVVLAIAAAGIAVAVKDADLRGVLAIMVQEAALFAIVLVWIRMQYDRGPAAIGLSGFTPKNLGVGIAVGAIGVFIAVLVSGVLGELYGALFDQKVQNPEQVPIEDPTPSGLILGLLALSVVLFAPVAEEVFWRGFLYRGLRRSMPAGTAILWSSVLFGAVHLSAATSWHLAGQYVFTLAIPIAILGAILAEVTERRGTIVPAIVAHVAFNAWGFIALRAADKV